jgi:hypothetical protein
MTEQITEGSPPEERAVPAQIKIDNGAFHVLARSDDPAIKCLNIGNLVTNLKTTMKLAGITEHDRLLESAGIGANRCWYEYSELKNPGRAVQTAKAVLEMVLFLVYDKRFATLQADSCVGSK